MTVANGKNASPDDGDPTMGPLDVTQGGPAPATPAPPPPGSATFWHQGDQVAPAVRAAGPPAFAPAPVAIRPGTVLGGDFDVLAPLGAGGMGAVYRARQRSLGREVALKVLPAECSTPQAIERFLREARVAAAVSHPNVITVFAAGRDESTGRLFIAMEFVPGGDAGALASRSGGRLDERRALEIARDVARGLTALEAAGMVHRDIKPANIFLGPDGAAKLADLGLARGAAERLTQTGAVVGTPAFMSPEQAEGRQSDIDSRTDIYAVGASLHALITGEAPYGGGSMHELLRKIFDAPPPDPRALVPTVSAATSAIVRRAMAKDRADRHASAAELVSDLERALAGLDSPAARPARSGAPRLLVTVALVAGVAALVVALGAPAGDDASVTSTSVVEPVTPVAPAPTPVVAGPAPITTSIRIAWRNRGPRSHPDFALTSDSSAREIDHKLTIVGDEQIEARFTLHDDPTWARLILDDDAARIGGQVRSWIDLSVNDVALLARGDPDDDANSRVDITPAVRAGANVLRIRLHSESVGGYWLRELEIVYGTGAPPE